MTGSWQPGELHGVWRRKLAFHADGRGAFAEIWRESWTEGLPSLVPGATMRQGNLSRSHARVLRGMHMHERQADLWIVLEGKAFVALVDLRSTLAEGGPVRSESIEADPGETLFLPEGIAHGFYAREPLTLLYLVTNEYDGKDEHGFAWDDATAGVPWPDKDPIISARDAEAPSLHALVEALRGGQQTGQQTTGR